MRPNDYEQARAHSRRARGAAMGAGGVGGAAAARMPGRVRAVRFKRLEGTALWHHATPPRTPARSHLYGAACSRICVALRAHASVWRCVLTHLYGAACSRICMALRAHASVWRCVLTHLYGAGAQGAGAVKAGGGGGGGAGGACQGDGGHDGAVKKGASRDGEACERLTGASGPVRGAVLNEKAKILGYKAGNYSVLLFVGDHQVAWRGVWRARHQQSGWGFFVEARVLTRPFPASTLTPCAAHTSSPRRRARHNETSRRARPMQGPLGTMRTRGQGA